MTEKTEDIIAVMFFFIANFLMVFICVISGG